MFGCLGVVMVNIAGPGYAIQARPTARHVRAWDRPVTGGQTRTCPQVVRPKHDQNMVCLFADQLAVRSVEILWTGPIWSCVDGFLSGMVWRAQSGQSGVF